MANSIDAIKKMQWGVICAFIDEKEYKMLNGIPLDAAGTKDSRAARSNQLHQKPTIKQQLRNYNTTQPDKLHQDLIS